MILRGGRERSRTGRLYKSLVLDKKLALEVDAGSASSLYPNLFVISATPAQGKTVPEVEKAIYEEIDKIQTERPTDEELARVRNGTDASLLRSLRSNFGVARVLASTEHLAGTWRYIFTEREKIKAVTAEEIQRAAKKYLTQENRTVAELRQKAGEGGGEPGEQSASAQRWEGSR